MYARAVVDTIRIQDGWMDGWMATVFKKKAKDRRVRLQQMSRKEREYQAVIFFISLLLL